MTCWRRTLGWLPSGLWWGSPRSCRRTECNRGMRDAFRREASRSSLLCHVPRTQPATVKLQPDQHTHQREQHNGRQSRWERPPAIQPVGCYDCPYACSSLSQDSDENPPAGTVGMVVRRCEIRRQAKHDCDGKSSPEVVRRSKSDHGLACSPCRCACDNVTGRVEPDARVTNREYVNQPFDSVQHWPTPVSPAQSVPTVPVGDPDSGGLLCGEASMLNVHVRPA